MEIEIIRAFNKRLYLKDLLKTGYNGLIPSNVILNKTLPGLGATTCEIESKRHSIIIEPNVPVIDGKVSKYPNERWPYPILGIKKGTKWNDIVKHLNNDAIPYKKILTTPESYQFKLKEVFTTLKVPYLTDYFFLLDECEKFIQDMDFRETLFYVMKDFWRYTKKAMVSATPIIPTDKAFVREEFRILKVQPKFNYSKPIIVTTTNSVLDSIKEYFDEKLKSGRVCFFINSVTFIHNVIKLLDIKDESRIFCGEDRFPKLKDLGYTDYNSIIKQNDNRHSDLKKYNFFTSRFFSAVDIDLEDKNVAVVVVTDNYSAPYTIVDPQTQVKQIIGRFRQESWVNIHITNIRGDMSFKTREYMESYTEGSYSGFKAVHTLYRNAENQVVKKALFDGLKQLRFFDYVYEYNNKLMINRGLIDNEIEREKVKQFYTNGKLLDDTYRDDAYYAVTSRSMQYENSDKSRYEHENMDLPELRKAMVIMNDKIIRGEMEGYITDYFTEYQLQKENQYILAVAHYLEPKDLDRFNYDPQIIDRALRILLDMDETEIPQFKGAIRESFTKGMSYSRAYISYKLNEIFTRFGVDKSTKATALSDYCLLSEAVNVGKNGIKLKGEAKRPKGFIILDHLLSE